MFTLTIRNVIRGLAAAIFTGAWVAIGGFFVAGFDVFTADWVVIGKTAINGGFLAFVGYITTNLLTADNGKILKVI